LPPKPENSDLTDREEPVVRIRSKTTLGADARPVSGTAELQLFPAAHQSRGIETSVELRQGTTRWQREPPLLQFSFDGKGSRQLIS